MKKYEAPDLEQVMFYSAEETASNDLVSDSDVIDDLPVDEW